MVPRQCRVSASPSTSVRVAGFEPVLPTRVSSADTNADRALDPRRVLGWSEGLHGPLEPCVTDGSVTKCPTNFPAASAMASAFNDTLYLKAGSAVGVEGRAISNLRKHDSSIGDGLTYWAPNANMERDPRWGRNQEAPGEDPHLTSKYIAAYVRGLQEGEDPTALYVWRLLIGADHQRKGYGTAALDFAKAKRIEMGLSCIFISAVDEPGSAIPLYEKEGFVRTGRIVDGETELVWRPD